MPVPIIRFGRRRRTQCVRRRNGDIAGLGRFSRRAGITAATGGNDVGHGDSSAIARGRAKTWPEPFACCNPTWRARRTTSRRVAILGDLYLLSNDLKSAERAYLNVTNVASTDRETHERLGNLYAREDRLDDAISQFEKVLPDTSAFADLVRTHKRRGDLNTFVESYRQAAEAFPKNAVAEFQYGVILVDLYKPQFALPYLVAASGAAPRACPVQTELGDALVDVGRVDDGIVAIQRCLTEDPTDYDGLRGARFRARFSRDATVARATLDRAVAVRPNRSEAIIDIGYIEDAADHRDAASALFTEGDRSRPVRTRGVCGPRIRAVAGRSIPRWQRRRSCAV